MERKKSALELLNNKKPRVNSVINPSAQYTTLYAANNLTAERSNLICTYIAPESNLSELEKAIIELMFVSGCRISEAISINSNDILKNGSIKLKGSKGSNDRIITVILYRNFWLRNKLFIKSILQPFTRFYFYRLFRKIGLTFHMSGKCNANVTHSLRQLYIESMNEGNISNELIKNSIGHKSINSQEYYKLNKEKKAKK